MHSINSVWIKQFKFKLVLGVLVESCKTFSSQKYIYFFNFRALHTSKEQKQDYWQPRDAEWMKNKLHMPETIWKLTLNENNIVTIPEWWLGEKRKYGLNPKLTWGSYMCLRVHRWLSHYRFNMKELKDIPQSTKRETQQYGNVWQSMKTCQHMIQYANIGV